MAEAVVRVCDECGRPDAKTITIRTDTGNYVKDLCAIHLKALIANTRAPRRGRPRTTARSGAAGSARKTKTAARKRTASKRSSRKTPTRS